MDLLISRIKEEYRCRVCSTKEGSFQSIFTIDDDPDPDTFTTFADMIMSLSSLIQININDGLPHEVCSHCSVKVKELYRFKLKMEETNVNLKSELNLSSHENCQVKEEPSLLPHHDVDITFKIENEDQASDDVENSFTNNPIYDINTLPIIIKTENLNQYEEIPVNEIDEGEMTNFINIQKVENAAEDVNKDSTTVSLIKHNHPPLPTVGFPNTPDRFSLISKISSSNSKFQTCEHTLTFKINPVPEPEDVVEWFKCAITEVVHFVTKSVQETDHIGFTFSFEDSKDKPYWMPFEEASRVTTEDIWKMLGATFENNPHGLNTDNFLISLTSVSSPKGCGRVKPGSYATFEEECYKRRGIIAINNRDNLCLPRAIIIAMAKKDKLRRNVAKAQVIAVEKLLKESGVQIPETGAGIEQLRVFQQFLKEYKIVVYEYGFSGRRVIFEGRNARALYKINLLHHNNHFNVITSLTRAFSCRYFCEDCHQPFNKRIIHNCRTTSCPCCRQSPSCEKVAAVIKCNECHRIFRGQICFDNHVKDVCRQLKGCMLCLETYTSEKKHICDEVYCKTCKKYREPHLCYVRIGNYHPIQKQKQLFIFYGFQTRNKLVEDNGSFSYEVNLCVSMQRCHVCIELPNLVICNDCGVRTQIISGSSSVTSLMLHIMSLRRAFKTIVCISHNLQDFYLPLILKYFIEKTDLKPKINMSGPKMLMLQVGNLRFINSQNYFPLSLADLPKAFDLGDKFKEGYFPDLFNTKTNSKYIGPLPEINFYNPNSMKILCSGKKSCEEVNCRNYFFRWYEKHKDDQFDMERNLVYYCKRDVQILVDASIKFRNMFLDECSICPFTEAESIASASKKVFRTRFLELDSVGVIPPTGYRWKGSLSKLCIQWLTNEEQKLGKVITHKDRVSGIRVDGYCKETGQIFEFRGCLDHGHDLCLLSHRNEPLNGDLQDTLALRFERTKSKTERLGYLGYEVVEMWECEFKRKLENDKKLRENLESHSLISKLPVTAHEAFYESRTGSTKDYYKCKSGEKIKYLNISSIYPWVCKFGKFPIGHPQFFYGETCKDLNIMEMEGVVKCTILPPQDLHFPVLPVKIQNRSMFLLCRSCGEQSIKGKCQHVKKKEQCLTGTWVIDEVRKALQKGYTLLEVHEVWEYRTTKFDISSKTGGLFATFINRFTQLKRQASGWPKYCQTEKERLDYIKNYLAKEGIQLDYGSIENNPCLRSLSKFMLDSFLGQFEQSQVQPRTSIVREPKELFDMLANREIIFNTVQQINEDVILVNWIYKEEADNSLPGLNEIIAAYVTAQARLKLYTYLDQLGERILYYDNDSIVYICRGEVDEFDPSTIELEEYGPGSYISEFISGGPKTFAYKIFSPNTNEKKTICKVRGISIDYSSSKLLNLESLKGIILNHPSLCITSHNTYRIQEYDGSCKDSKLSKINFRKRKCVGDSDIILVGSKQVKS